jgi:hypothetical protein
MELMWKVVNNKVSTRLIMWLRIKLEQYYEVEWTGEEAAVTFFKVLSCPE